MKKTLEFLFLAFCGLFFIPGVSFLITNLQSNPDVVKSDKETNAIQSQLDAMKPPATSSNSYCEKVASELAQSGQLSSLPRNPSCSNWNIPAAYYEQDQLAIANIQNYKKEEESKQFDRQFNLIKASYLDKEASLTSKYNKIVQGRNIDYNNGQITIGQYNYFRSIDKTQYLDKVISNKEQMISVLRAEINKHVDVSALYTKYQISKDAGAETLAAIADSASVDLDKKMLTRLAYYKNSSELDNLRTQSTEIKQKLFKEIKDQNRGVRELFFRQTGYYPPEPNTGNAPNPRQPSEENSP